MASLARSLVVCSLVSLATAVFPIADPSDQIAPTAWASDNAILADYSPMPLGYQAIAPVAPTVFNDTTASINHKAYYVDGNDTSTVIVTQGSQLNFSYVDITKFGYSSNLIEGSFYGVNAALWIGNDSTSYINDINVTVYNGAANIFIYGTDSIAYVDNAFLYSSGPVSHGIYAAGNGTVYANNIKHYSGGNRCSSFSGDSPGGYVHVTDAVAHTDGVGSAIRYALGLCNMTNVIGKASLSPVMFLDSMQTGIWKNCDLTAGHLAEMVLFSSSTRSSGAAVTLDHSQLTTLGSTMPSLWFGNTIATATIISSALNNSASNLLVVANYSQLTQDFDYFASYVDNPSLSPAIATVNVAESNLSGDLVAYNGSSINFTLSNYSSWKGKAYSGYGNAYFDINLDATSNWTVTGATILQNFTNANTQLTNVFDKGAPATGPMAGAISGNAP